MAYTQEEQVEIVHKALMLETAIHVEKNDVQLLKGQRFDRFPSYAEAFRDVPPEKPQRQTVAKPEAIEPDIPEPPEAEMPSLMARPLFTVFCIACLAIGAVLIVSGFINSTGAGMPGYSYLSFPLIVIAAPIFYALASGDRKRLHQEENEKLANSPEYLAKVEQAKRDATAKQAEVDEQCRQKQERLDAQYASELERYETFLAPEFEKLVAEHHREYEEMRAEYEEEKREWEEKRVSAITMMGEDILANKKALDELYDTTRLLSVHYREIPLLQWLYDDMSSSDHDIRYATELLDRHRQRVLTEEAAQRTITATDRLYDEVHQLGTGVMQLQSVQIEGLRYLESELHEILRTTEDIYGSAEAARETSKKILFHQRVNTAEIAVQEWRRHKAKKTLR